ncbi:MAG: protein kinase [Gemmatimonadota bacterium]|jgi:serine/threonine protein kinase|nr:protein kinase [Gemmatimonadota bacterium]
MAGIESLLVGRTLGGRYRIEEVIGRGGMGAVYRALDERLDRPVALKVIIATADGDARDRLRHRFFREARSAAALPHHPNIVPVYDYGSDETLGIDFLVMELLRGSDLATRLSRAGAPPLSTSARILLEAARGLAVGHARGVIHRDVKPGNIFLARTLDNELQVRIVDFGIAKLADDDTLAQLTQDGRAPHSPAYASPEQLRGLAELTPAADVFGLGAVGFLLLTGERPFSEADRSRMSLGMPVEVPSLRALNPAVPEAIEAVVRKSLAFDPEARYPTAGKFAEALETAMRTLPDALVESTFTGAPIIIATGEETSRGISHGIDGNPEDGDRTLLSGDLDDRTMIDGGRDDRTMPAGNPDDHTVIAPFEDNRTLAVPPEASAPVIGSQADRSVSGQPSAGAPETPGAVEPRSGQDASGAPAGAETRSAGKKSGVQGTQSPSTRQNDRIRSRDAAPAASRHRARQQPEGSGWFGRFLVRAAILALVVLGINVLRQRLPLGPSTRPAPTASAPETVTDTLDQPGTAAEEALILSQRGVEAYTARPPRYAEALSLFAQAVRLAPRDWHYRRNHAMVLSQLGNHQAALLELETALALDSTQSVIWVSLGSTQLARGDTAAALDAFRRSTTRASSAQDRAQVAGIIRELEAASRRRLPPLLGEPVEEESQTIPSPESTGDTAPPGTPATVDPALTPPR